MTLCVLGMGSAWVLVDQNRACPASGRGDDCEQARKGRVQPLPLVQVGHRLEKGEHDDRKTADHAESECSFHSLPPKTCRARLSETLRFRK